MDGINQNTPAERLRKIMQDKGVHTMLLAYKMRMRGEILYTILRGEKQITEELADRICRLYPNICREWLLTGEGDAYVE